MKSKSRELYEPQHSTTPTHNRNNKPTKNTMEKVANRQTPTGTDNKRGKNNTSKKPNRGVYATLGHEDVRTLKGVGPQLEKLLHKLGCNTVASLLFHLPLRHEDHTRVTPITKAPLGQTVIIEGSVEQLQLVTGNKRHLKCTVSDATGEIQIIFFQTAKYLQARLTPGAQLRCLGTVSYFGQQKRMLHPKLLDVAAPINNTHLTPVYPLTVGLSQTKLRPLIRQAIIRARAQDWLRDYIPTAWRTSHALPSLADALEYLHRPPQAALNDTGSLERAQQRIGLEALMAHQIALASMHEHSKKTPGTPLPLSNTDLNQFLKHFPFAPTEGQSHCLRTFQTALTENEPMRHLLQGDVGSGKTLLAAVLAFAAASNGYQAAIMAPTELLANQHAKQFQEWLTPFGFNVALLSGRVSATEKRKIYQDLAKGDIHIVVGTHALIQPQVEFQNLAACVIDEQHRFGVEQRLALQEKGANPHLLLMTATPIPRSLAMAVYGNLKSIELQGRPAQRKPITTSVLSETKRDKLIAQLRAKCLAGEQVYWVCPRISPQDTLLDESTLDNPLEANHEPATSCHTTNSAQTAPNEPNEPTAVEGDIGLAAETAFEEFAQKLPDLSLGLVHGRMSDDEKAAVMARFRAGEHHILIATTVIEVGIDVPNANIIVIESANRFGLSQLHQLRGRVGRGDRAAHCILLYQSPLSKKGKTRLQVLREQTDGFRIAEQDLEQRGPGLWLGTAQSGSDWLPFASFAQAPHLIELAQTWSQALQITAPSDAEALRQRWHADPLRYANA